MIALITPTGARPKQIHLCAEFMRRQDYKGQVLWIVVDDALPVTTEDINEGFGENWKIVTLQPKNKWRKGQNTQANNLILGANLLYWYIVDYVFIIEDDDYYSPKYLSSMMKELKDYDVAGQTRTVYYNPVLRGWFQNGNDHHASLFQVAFKIDVLPTFVKTCQMGKTFIDMNFFRAVQGKNINLFRGDGRELAVGIKGLPGRDGIGMGHRLNDIKLNPDPKLDKLKELIGRDYKYYV